MGDARVNAGLRASRIVWGALLASMAIYVVIADVVVSNKAPDARVPMPELASAPTSHPLFWGLVVMGVLELSIGLLARGRIMPVRRRTDTSPRDVNKALQRMRVAEIIGWAFCEAVAINGLILTMLSYELRFSLGFTAVGALAMLALAPSQQLLDDVVRAASPD